MGNENSQITFPIQNNNHNNKMKIYNKKIKTKDISNKPIYAKNKNQKNAKILKNNLIKTAIVIFSLHEKEYLQMEFSDIMNHLKNLENNKYNEDNFIESMKKVKFDDKIISKIHQPNEEYLLFE